MRWSPRGALALVTCVGLVVVTGCGGKQSPDDGIPSTLSVERSERGRVLQLVVGQELHVMLPADPSSLYTWVLREGAEQLIRQQGPPVFTQESQPGVADAAGRMVANFRFLAHAAGQADLRFEYKDPANAQPASRAWYRISVR